MTKSFLQLISIVSITSFLVSCGTTKINSEKPQSQIKDNTPPFERKVSIINLPVNIPVKKLEDKLNTELENELYSNDNLKDGMIAVKVTRAGKIVVEAENDKIYFTVPVHIFVKGTWEWKPCSVCPTLSKSESTEFELKVKGTTELDLAKDWKLNSKTTLDYVWGKKPNIEFGPVKISIAGLVEPVLNSQMKDLGDILDGEMQKKINLKEMVSKAWVTIQQPMIIDPDYNTFLILSPQEIKSTPITCKGNSICMKVGIKTFVETMSGDMPPRVPQKDLPNLIIDKNVKDNFNISLAAEVTYVQAGKILNKQFQGQEFVFNNEKYKIKVDTVEVFGSENKMTLKMGVNGSAKQWIFKKKIKGTIFLQGTPYYDAASGNVKIKDFDFNVKSKDVLLKSAAWVTKVGFKEKIKDLAQIPLKSKLEEARKNLQDGIDKNGQINDMILLKGNITNLQPVGIYLSPSSMKIVVSGEGGVTVELNKL
ncbi:MAG: DUF4403 family protein [Bacteroidetes bacterium]|nr:DUF4403 family protein [Bacteroidota bacterium]